MQEERMAEHMHLAACGAHMEGLPLNGQLTERGGRLVRTASTAPLYRLFELSGAGPRRPGLVRVREGGASIALEVWMLPVATVGSLLALIPPPLGLGTLALADGESCKGFLCEWSATLEAKDITEHGGWRAYLTSLGEI